MKKILMFLSLFMIILLVGCGKQAQEELMILTNQEKVELLQEMQMPIEDTIKLESQIKASVNERLSVYNIDCNIKSYSNLKDLRLFTNYTNLDFNIKLPKNDVYGKGNIYLTNRDAYLDVDATIKSGGTETNIRSKEVMSLSRLIDPKIIIQYYDRFNLDFIRDFDPIAIVNELKYFIDLIDVYKKGNEYRFEVKVTKDQIIAAKNYLKDFNIPYILTNITSDSYVTLNVIFDKNEIKHIKVLSKLDIYQNDNAINIDASLLLEYNPTVPQLPSKEQLNNFNEVEFFTILDNLKLIE